MPGSEKYAAAGMCRACGQIPEPGKKKCTACLIKSKESSDRWRAHLQMNKLCVYCRKSNDRHPKVTCTGCYHKLKDKRQFLKASAFEAYGGVRCSCCGVEHIEFLTIDHINNDGASHRRQVAKDAGKSRRNSKGWKVPGNGRGVLLYAWLRRNNYPAGFQVLCLNCNAARAWYGVCPHKR